MILSFGTGGAERLVVDLMENCDKSRFDVVAVSLFPFSNKPFEVEIEKKGLKIVYLSCKKSDFRSYIKTIFDLYRIIKSFRPHVVHSHLKTLPFLAGPYLLLKVPVKIHTIHSIAEKDASGLTRFVNKICFKFLNVVPVSISQQVAESVNKLYGKRIATPMIYNGINVKKFFTKNSRLIFHKDKFILLNVARFVPQKNHELLIEAYEIAARSLEKRNIQLQLWLVGDGPLRKKIEILVRSKRLEERVKFFGERGDIENILAHADIFVLSSDYEGFGLVVLEALAAGLPVIATKVAGVTEVLRDGEFGILVPPRNPVALAEAIVNLVIDREKYKNLSEIGRKFVENYFDIRATVAKYEKLYLQLLQNNKT